MMILDLSIYLDWVLEVRKRIRHHLLKDGNLKNIRAHKFDQESTLMLLDSGWRFKTLGMSIKMN